MISIRAAVEKRGRLLTDRNALEAYRRGVIAGGVEAVEMTLAAVVRSTPVGETGTLWKGWQKSVRLGVPFWGLIFNPVPYGEIVEGGSRAHEIRPRFKKALAFIPGGGPGLTTWAQRLGSGKTVFARRVRHPGTRPQRFVSRTVQRLEDGGAWERLWSRVVDNIIKELGK